MRGTVDRGGASLFFAAVDILSDLDEFAAGASIAGSVIALQGVQAFADDDEAVQRFSEGPLCACFGASGTPLVEVGFACELVCVVLCLLCLCFLLAGICHIEEFLQSARNDAFLFGAHPAKRDGEGAIWVEVVCLLRVCCGEDLGDELRDEHVAGVLVSKDASAHVFCALFAHLDVGEGEGVEADVEVFADALEPAVWLPVVGPEGDADGLTKVVAGETAGADGGHDAGIVDDLDGDGRRGVLCPKDEVGVCGCGERVADDEKGDVGGGSAFEY